MTKLFDRNDPLLSGINDVLRISVMERQAMDDIHEQLGIVSRNALPHEFHEAYDMLKDTAISEARRAIKPDVAKILSEDRFEGLRKQVSTAVKKKSDLISEASKFYGRGQEGNYTIKRGDTLSAIARRSGMTVQDLQKLNPGMTNANRIAAGGRLRTVADKPAAVPLPTPRPSTALGAPVSAAPSATPVQVKSTTATASPSSAATTTAKPQGTVINGKTYDTLPMVLNKAASAVGDSISRAVSTARDAMGGGGTNTSANAGFRTTPEAPADLPSSKAAGFNTGTPASVDPTPSTPAVPEPSGGPKKLNSLSNMFKSLSGGYD